MYKFGSRVGEGTYAAHMKTLKKREDARVALAIDKQDKKNKAVLEMQKQDYEKQVGCLQEELALTSQLLQESCTACADLEGHFSQQALDLTKAHERLQALETENCSLTLRLFASEDIKDVKESAQHSGCLEPPTAWQRRHLLLGLGLEVP